MISDPIAVKREERQSHEGGRGKAQQHNLDRETIWNLEPGENQYNANKLKHKFGPRTEEDAKQEIIWNLEEKIN